MSVLPSATNFTLSDAFFVKVVGASTITANSFIGDRGIFDSLSTGSITVNSISSSGTLVVGDNLIVGNDITALNITATDSLTTYFANTQYITSEQGANIKSLLLANQIQGSNLVQFPNAILSSITTTSITLDGNTLDTAGGGSGAVLLLNGQPVATASTLTSSILTWSLYPAIAPVDLSGQSLFGVTTLDADIINGYDLNAVNQITFGTNLFGTTGNLTTLKATNISTTALVASNLSTITLQSRTLSNSGTLTSQQADITTLNTTSITTDTLTTLAGGTVSGANGSFQNLNVSASANFSGSRPNFTTGINSSGANNFNNQSLDNCPNINTQGNTSMNIQSANAMELKAPTFVRLICDAGCNIAGYGAVELIGRNGNRGQVNITAQPGFISVGGQIQGEVNIVANGGGSLTAYATGGLINITANTGSSPVLGTLTYSAIKLNAAGITSYAGFASPFIAVPGYNLIQGSLGIELIAGSIPVIPNVPGTVYLYGATGIPQQTGGIRAQNGLGIDFIVPYPQGFNTQPYDLIISGNPAGQKVTLSNVRILQSDSGSASGFASISGTNITAKNFILSKDSVDNGLLLGLSGGEQLINFSNVSTLNVRAGQGTFFQTINQQVSTQSLFISTINGLPFSAIIAPTIPSTFSDLTTNLLQANTISTNALGAFILSNVSSVNGFSIAQLVSSVSPQAPAPSTFLQLFTSSFVATTILANNISTVSLQGQSITGVSTINGFTIADFVSSVSPQAPAPSTFQQLFTSSFVANTITGASFSPGLKLLGAGVTIEPSLDNSITLKTTGVGLLTAITDEEVQVFAPSTIVFGDFRATTINGQSYPPPPTTNYTQLFTSSLQANGINTATLTASQILLNGAALSPQASTFNTLAANQISTASLLVSSISGYSLNQIVNQPVVSSFVTLTTSTLNALNGGILFQTGITLDVSSINGYNVEQFLSTANPAIQISTFGQLFTSSFVASDVSTITLKTSSINGFNISQLINQPIVSSFQQLYTSSFAAQTISTGALTAGTIVASNVSTIGVQALFINGVSSISGFSIAQLVSSVAPQPPIPSTVNQFYTSSLAVNGITNYQTGDLRMTTSAFMDLYAGVALRLEAGQCNVAITAPSLLENIGQFTTNNTGLDYAVTAGRNLNMNSSNTLSIYNTNTAPPVGCNDLYILGQGTTTFAGQGTTNLTAGNNILVNAVATTGIQGQTVSLTAGNIMNQQANFVSITGSNQILLTSPQELRATSSNLSIGVPSEQSYIYLNQDDGIEATTNKNVVVSATSNIALNSATLTINGAPYSAGVSSFTTVFTDNIRNNASNSLTLVSPILNMSNFIYNISTNGFTVTSSDELQLGCTEGIVLNAQTIALNSATLTINGAPYSPGISSFTTVFTDNIRNNATNNISMVSPILNMSNFIYNISTNGFTVTSSDELQLGCSEGIVLNAQTVALNAPSTICSGDIRAVTFNGLPLPTSGSGTVTSTFTQLNTNILSNNPTIGNDLFIRASNSIQLGDTGATGISLGGIFQVSGGAGGTLIETDYFNSFNRLISFTALDTFDLLASSNLTITGQSTINLTSSNINLFTPSTICSGDIRALTFNGLPLPTSGGGGSVVSTFTQLNTNILSNNPAISNDLKIRAGNAIVLNDTGETTVSLGVSLVVTGLATGTVDIQTAELNSLNNFIELTAFNTLDLLSLSSLTVTGQSSINLTSPALLWNGNPLAVASPVVYFSSMVGLGIFPTIFFSTGQDFFIGSSDNPIGNQIKMTDSVGVEIFSASDLVLGGRGYTNLNAGGILGSYIDIQADANINITAPTINLQAISTICDGDIRASTFNGAPLPTGSIVSSYTTLFTTTLSNNPVSSDLTVSAQSNLFMTAENYTAINTPIIKFQNFSGTQGGWLTIDSNAQLNYASQLTGYGVGDPCPIPLVQENKVTLTITDEMSTATETYTLPCPFDDGEFAVTITHQSATPITPPEVVNWCASAVTSNTFTISAIGSNITTPLTLSFYYIAVGKYARGVPT